MLLVIKRNIEHKKNNVCMFGLNDLCVISSIANIKQKLPDQIDSYEKGDTRKYIFKISMVDINQIYDHGSPKFFDGIYTTANL